MAEEEFESLPELEFEEGKRDVKKQAHEKPVRKIVPMHHEKAKICKLKYAKAKHEAKHVKPKLKTKHTKLKPHKLSHFTKEEKSEVNLKNEIDKIATVYGETQARASETSKVKIHALKPTTRVFNPRDNKNIAMDFAILVYKKFDTLIKATILFGSEAKGEATPYSDIDIVIIVDDAAVNWDLELIAWYREELAKLIASTEYAKNLHINTIKLTTWWNDLMHGDPVVINILRYGEPLIDVGGFFHPIKALLYQGKIHSTPEAVHAALQRAPMHLARSKSAELGAVEGVFWAMVDSAQAALITLGRLPPSPEKITLMLRESFVDTKLMNIEYVKWYRDIFQLHKSIAHGEVKNIKGQEIELWQERAEKFLLRMTEIIDMLIEARKAGEG